MVEEVVTLLPLAMEALDELCDDLFAPEQRRILACELLMSLCTGCCRSLPPRLDEAWRAFIVYQYPVYSERFAHLPYGTECLQHQRENAWAAALQCRRQAWPGVPVDQWAWEDVHVQSTPCGR